MDGWMGAAPRREKGGGKQAGPAFPVPGDSGVGTRVARCNGGWWWWTANGNRRFAGTVRSVTLPAEPTALAPSSTVAIFLALQKSV
jgi:hypothetical protein